MAGRPGRLGGREAHRGWPETSGGGPSWRETGHWSVKFAGWLLGWLAAELAKGRPRGFLPVRLAGKLAGQWARWLASWLDDWLDAWQPSGHFTSHLVKIFPSCWLAKSASRHNFIALCSQGRPN